LRNKLYLKCKGCATAREYAPHENYLAWSFGAFRLETAKATILIDPFFSGNPSFEGNDRKEAVKGVTHILLTHGHGDHVGDTA
jgi:glyoxylase-like metal-dependent hydrolase (beta-lactamase superfamily II)